MAYPPDLPPATRTDSTLSAVNHARDHNLAAAALRDLVEELGAGPAGSYASLTERLLGIAAGQDQAALDAFNAASAAVAEARAAAEAARDEAALIAIGDVDQTLATLVDPSTGSKFSSALTGAFVARVGVALTVDAQVDRFLPVGFDAPTNRIFATHDTTRRALFYSDDPELRVWKTVTEFEGGTVIRRVFITEAGTLLALVTTASGWEMRRSEDEGETWVTALSGSGTVFALGRGVCQLPNGSIFFGEYRTDAGPYDLHLWRSRDDGASWEAAQTWTPAGASSIYPTRHVHAVLPDPYVTDRLWICIGDTDSQARVGYSDDDGESVTWIGSGDQSWRTVDLLFTPEAVIMADDAANPNVQKIRSWDRITGERTDLVDVDTGGPFYYGVLDDEGRFLWTQPAENGELYGKVWTGRANGDPANTKQVITLKTPASLRTDVLAYGPGADGRILLGISHATLAGTVSMLQRVHLSDAEVGAAGVNPPNYFTTTRPAALEAGGMASAGAELSAGAGVVYFVKVRPDVDFLARVIQYGVGSASAGNVSAGICETAASGAPGAVLGRSPVTGVGGQNLSQALVLSVPVMLVKGVDYWAWLTFDSGSAKFKGHNAQMGVAALSRWVTGQTMPPAGPFPGATTSSIRPALVLSQ